MKTRLILLLSLLTLPVALPLQAAPAPLTLRKTKPPIALVRKLGGAKILQSGLAPLGLKHNSCWALWLRPRPVRGKKTESIFSIWKPNGKNRFAKIGDWPLQTNNDFGAAKLAWLNENTRTGWVMDYYVEDEGTTLIAFPQGAKTLRKDLVISGPFFNNATSIYATYYEFGNYNSSGQYTFSKTYSEPGMNDEGQTISIEDAEVYYWAGKNWDMLPKK